MGLIESLLKRVRRLPQDAGGTPSSCDPAVRAELTASLARLDREILRVRHGDAGDYARAHHLYAAVRAYGDVLDQACREAGVERDEGDESLRRLMAEIDLRSRGWSW